MSLCILTRLPFYKIRLLYVIIFYLLSFCVINGSTAPIVHLSLDKRLTRRVAFLDRDLPSDFVVLKISIYN